MLTGCHYRGPFRLSLKELEAWARGATVAEAEVCLEFRGAMRWDTMNYEAKQWRELAEALLFDFGFLILGERSLVAKLFHKLGISETRRVLKLAATKSDAREYVGAVLRDRQEKIGPALSEERIEQLWKDYKAKIQKTV